MTTVRTAVITGAGQGMGRAIALKFAQGGFHIALVGRTKEKLEAVATQIKELGQTASVHAMDVTDHERVRNLAESLRGKPVDLLINCAGEALIKPFEETTEEEAEEWVEGEIREQQIGCGRLDDDDWPIGYGSIVNILQAFRFKQRSIKK